MSINKKDKEIFGISNFKPFRDLQEIDLAPITLVYGQNSGGKSSLLEALLCTNQSLEDNQIEQGVFNLSGKNFNSGTYASVINKFNKDDFIYLKFKPRFSQIPKKRSEFYLNSLEPLRMSWARDFVYFPAYWTLKTFGLTCNYTCINIILVINFCF